MVLWEKQKKVTQQQHYGFINFSYTVRNHIFEYQYEAISVANAHDLQYPWNDAKVLIFKTIVYILWCVVPTVDLGGLVSNQLDESFWTGNRVYIRMSILFPGKKYVCQWQIVSPKLNLLTNLL